MYIRASARDKRGLSFGLQGFTPRSSPALGDDDAWEVKATQSDSLMRFLLQINKQAWPWISHSGAWVCFCLGTTPHRRTRWFKMIHQTETNCTNKSLNKFTVTAAATRISYQTPSAGLLSSARFEYQVNSPASLPLFNSLFVPCVYREDFRSQVISGTEVNGVAQKRANRSESS